MRSRVWFCFHRWFWMERKLRLRECFSMRCASASYVRMMRLGLVAYRLKFTFELLCWCFKHLGWVSSCLCSSLREESIAWICTDEFLGDDGLIKISWNIFYVWKKICIKIRFDFDALFWFRIASKLDFFTSEHCYFLIPFHNLFMLRSHSDLSSWSI